MIAIAALAVVAGIFTIRHCSRATPPPVTALRVELTASPTRVLYSGRVALRTRVTDQRGRALPASALHFKWSAPLGVVRAKDSGSATWTAPLGAGPVQIEVVVTDGHGLSAHAAVVVEVASPPDHVDPRPTEAWAEPGYEIGPARADRDKLCIGSDVRFTVDEAHDPDGSRSWIYPRFFFAGTNVDGFTGVLRTWPTLVELTPPDQLGVLEIQLFDTRTNQVVASRKQTFRVEQCPGETLTANVKCDRDIDGSGTIACTLAVPKDASVVSTEWRLMLAAHQAEDLELTRITTPSAYASFATPAHSEEGATSTFIVTATATTRDGKTINGRTSWLVPNLYWTTAELEGVLNLVVRSSGYPDPGPGPGLTMSVWVQNPATEAVVVDSVDLEKVECKEPSKLVPFGHEAVASFLGTSRLDAGKSVTLTWKSQADPERCSLEAVLRGHGEESNLPVFGRMVMLTDPSMARAPTDQELRQVQKALAILSKRRGQAVYKVSVEELRALANEGLIERLDDQPGNPGRDPSPHPQPSPGESEGAP